jgi:hypothetical protein
VARALWLEAAALLLLGLALVAWFASWPLGLPPAVPCVLLAAVLAARFASPVLKSLRARPYPYLETASCLLLALAYRWPAVAHPWGWVNKDGAFGAFIAIHLLDGQRPAPVFTEGANYQGSLKGHLAAFFALVTGQRDFSWLMVLASLALYLAFMVVSMDLSRRIAGRGAALFTGLFLALSPKFLTTFSLNCVGQYVDVLALGGAALALLGRLLEEGRSGREGRLHYLGIGLLLGAAFWQQPVALAYGGGVFLALAGRRRTWSDPWAITVLPGLFVGALPVLLWNLRNDWGSSGILGREPEELLAQAEALPVLVARTLRQAFPVLAGLSPGHPLAHVPGVRGLALCLLPAIALAYAVWLVVSHGDRTPRPPRAALLPLLLLATNLALFWATASGSINKRPRYLLPALAALAVMLGVVTAWGWARARALTVLGFLGALTLAVTGTMPRLRESASIEAFWRGAVRSLEEKGIRTGYSDFSVSAPITMFTGERITLSARLGPTPAYHSDRQDERVLREGPDAYVLPRGDDPGAFAAAIEALGVRCAQAPLPFPTFWSCSRRVRLEEVIGFRGEERAATAEEE